MTKKRFLIAIAIVMVLILSVAVFVACNENQTKSYTVKFVDGESEVKSVSVEEGKTIADADIPADLTKDGYVFEGWYVGDVAFDKSAAITADVTYSAKWTKLHTVKFVDGDETIKTATVKDGEKLKDADIPADLTASGKVFEGWFDGTTAFDKDATITADKTFAAKWVGLFNVTFKNGEETIKVAQVKDGAVIAAADIPEDPTDDNYAFIGWFVGETAYDSSAAVTSDIVVSAKFSTFFKSYIGTWHGATDDWDSISYTVVVDATSITVTIGDADAQAATDIDVDTTDGTVKFKLGDTEYKLYAYYDGNLRIYESSEIKLSAELEGRVHVSSSDIVGTYTTEGGHTIVINKTFVKVDDVLGTGFYYNASSGYSWSIGDNYSSLAYDSSVQAWIYKEGTSSDADKLIVPELTAIDIPAEFIGNWYGTVESFGQTKYFLVKVTADGVFAYNPGSGFAKVGVATEYKDGKLTVVGLDETITASIADGKLAYKSDAAYGADYQLEKGTVVVFENNYSVFYIAKLGADNKIDQSTFALEDPQMKAGYTFKGWLSDLDYVTEFDEDATFADSTVFVGSSEKTGYVVTFKKTSSDSDPVIAVVEKTNGKLTADQIPADLTYEDGSVFTGWYTTAGVKAVADLTISDDTTFIAKSVKESDYEGTWVSTAKGKEAVLVVADGKVSFGEISGVSYTFNADGSISYGKWGDGSAKYSFVLTNSGIKATYRHFDADGYDFEEDVYELVTPKNAGLNSRVAGTYQYNKSDVIIIDANGIITKFGSSAPVYGFVTGTSTSNLTISYKASKYSRDYSYTGCSYKVKYMIIDKKIYVKDVKSAVDYYNTDAGSIIEFTRMNGSKEEKLYTYKYSYLATIEGTVADGEIVTVSYTDSEGSKSMIIKISGTKYIVAGAERGTHTGDEGALVLDGFGTAKLGDADETTYTVNGMGNIIIGEKAYAIADDGSYSVLQKDAYAGKYVRSDRKAYNFTLDGFGGVKGDYTGKYVFNEDKSTFTISGGSGYDGTYDVVENGKAFVNSNGRVYVLEGYTVENKLAIGYWESSDKSSSLDIMGYDGSIFVRIDGKNVQIPTWNYNCSILTVKVDSKTLDITQDGDTLVFNGVIYTASTRTVDTAKLFGTWQLVYNKLFTFEFLEDGNVNVVCVTSIGTKTKTVKYTVKDATYTFVYDYDTYICAFVDGKMTVASKDSDGYTNFSDLIATKIADPEGDVALDAFAGTWKTADGKFTFTFDGKGTVTNEEGRSYAYTVKDGKASFSDGTNAIVCTISGNSLTAAYDDGEYQFTKTFTKEAAATLDAFAGTWVGKPFASEVTLVCDGKGSGTFAGNAITYTVKGDTIEFECGGCACVVTKSGDKLSFTCDDSEYMPDFDLTKRA